MHPVKRLDRPDSGITRPEVITGTQNIAVTREVWQVEAGDGVPLGLIRKFAPKNGLPVRREPVLLLHGFAQNHLTFDLTGASFANYLAARDFDVWIADFRGHGVSRELGARHASRIMDYARLDLPAFIDAVLQATGFDYIHAAGHSLGGTLLYVTEPNWRTALKSVTTIASPFNKELSLVKMKGLAWVTKFVERFTPLGILWEEVFHLDTYGMLSYRTWPLMNSPLIPVLPFRGWYPGSMDPIILQRMLREGYDQAGGGVLFDMLEWIRTNNFPIDDMDDPLGTLACPILFVAADRDELVPARVVEHAFNACGSPEKAFVSIGDDAQHAGHLDIVLGKESPRRLWHQVAAWLREHTRVPMTAVGESQESLGA